MNSRGDRPRWPMPRLDTHSPLTPFMHNTPPPTLTLIPSYFIYSILIFLFSGWGEQDQGYKTLDESTMLFFSSFIGIGKLELDWELEIGRFGDWEIMFGGI